MSEVSTHVLDTTRGEPARGIVVRLERVGGVPGAGPGGTGPAGPQVTELGRAVTDADGRVAGFGVTWLPAGTYRLTFETGAYLRAAGAGAEPFFPEVAVTFTADGLRPRYHVPLLLSQYSYSTYRGS